MEPIRFKKLGVIPYERTGKELRVGQAGAPTPPQAPYEDMEFFSTEILMQGLAPECGGYSLAFLIAYLISLSSSQKLSGTFAYAYEKKRDGVPNTDGTTIQAIGITAHEEGVCLEDLFPDDSQNAEGAPTTTFGSSTSQSITDAATRSGWIPLFLTDLSWNGIQAAIKKYKAVIIEAQVGEEWYTSPAGKTSWAASDVLPIRPPQKVIDAHFFVAGGRFDAQETWFANSWSNLWGQNGFGYFKEDYVPFIKNVIVLYKAPASVQTVVTHPALSGAEKMSIIQQILDDIEKAVGLISQEIG